MWLLILLSVYLAGVTVFSAVYYSWGFPLPPSVRAAAYWPVDLIERWL